MPACEFGSEIKPSVTNDTFWLTAADLINQVASRLPYVGTFLAGLEAQIAPRLVDLQSICATVPPDPPNFDFEAWLRGGGYPALTTILQDWLFAWWRVNQWNTFCQCKSSTTCPSYNVIGSFSSTSGGVITGSLTIVTVSVPSGATSHGLVLNNWTYSGGETACRIRVQVFNASNAVLSTNNWTMTTQAKPLNQGTLSLAAGAHHITYTFTRATNGAGAQSVNGVMSFYGSCVTPGTPYTEVTVPAAPDVPAPPAEPTGCTIDDLCSRLAHVESALGIIATEVDETYLWTQNAGSGGGISVGYSIGTNHTGLSGAGEFTISASDVRGFLVTVTTRPSYIGTAVGLPTALFRLGWVTPGDSNGYAPSVAIHHTPVLIYDQWNTWKKLGYSLADGVTIAVRELLPV